MTTTLVAAGAIDCDIHAEVPSIEALAPYLDDRWREVIRVSGFQGPLDTAYPASAATTLRPELRAAGLKAVGLPQVQADVLDGLGVAVGILNCAYAVDSLHNPDAQVAVARAVNDWLAAEWLAPEPRLRASITVPTGYPDEAAREIERAAGSRGFVQVALPVRSAVPYGNRRYWPIFEAAARLELPAALQFGGAPGNPPSPVGWPTTYVEEYVGMASVYQSQLVSLVAEGVFDRFPTLRAVVLEGGFTWLPSLLWRLDKDWKGIRREVPWVRRNPSAYLREHVRFTLQPVDAPTTPQQLGQIVLQLGSDELLLFSTDYPHWHGDRLADCLPAGLPAGQVERIMAANARAIYGPRLG